MNNTELIKEAKKVLENSYSPYSNFAVGAALECKDGSIYLGTNIENASYPVTLCAERCAFASAVADGKREFVKIAIVSSDNKSCPPCGMCRQFMSEFCDGDFEIVLEDKSYKLSQLLPSSFSLE